MSSLVNSNHYVPKFLQKGWESSARGLVWVHDLVSNSVPVIERRPIVNVGSVKGSSAVNAGWTEEVEQAAAKLILKARHSRSIDQTQTSRVSRLNWSEAQRQVFHAFFWTLHARNEDIPLGWRKPGEAELLLLILERGLRAFDAFLAQFAEFQVSLGDAEMPMGLGSTTAFALRPVKNRSVLILPTAPRAAVVIADRRINENEISEAWAGMRLGELSFGTPSSFFLLPEETVPQEAGEERDALSLRLIGFKRTWQPKIMTQWGIRSQADRG